MKNNYEVNGDLCPPCSLSSGTLEVLQVTDDDGEVLDTLLIMLKT